MCGSTGCWPRGAGHRVLARQTGAAAGNDATHFQPSTLISAQSTATMGHPRAKDRRRLRQQLTQTHRQQLTQSLTSASLCISGSRHHAACAALSHTVIDVQRFGTIIGLRRAHVGMGLGACPGDSRAARDHDRPRDRLGIGIGDYTRFFLLHRKAEYTLLVTACCFAPYSLLSLSGI